RVRIRAEVLEALEPARRLRLVVDRRGDGVTAPRAATPHEVGSAVGRHGRETAYSRRGHSGTLRRLVHRSYAVTPIAPARVGRLSRPGTGARRCPEARP